MNGLRFIRGFLVMHSILVTLKLRVLTDSGYNALLATRLLAFV